MLKEKINHEFVTAFKNKNTFRKDTLGGLKAKITEAEKKKNNVELTDEEVYGVISTMIKQREQAKEMYEKNIVLAYKREDSEKAKLNAQKEEDEILILKEFMPTQMTDEEIHNTVCSFIAESFVFSGKENSKAVFGAVMKEFNSNYKGQFDNKKLKEITEKILEL